MNDATGAAGGCYAVLSVENTGPIANGEVHLRPLTVFAGPSNTGKSWFATLVYAVLNESAFFRALLNVENLKLDDEFKGTFLENAAGWARQTYNREIVDFSDNDWLKLKSIMEKAYADGYGDFIQRCFGLSNMDDLTRKGAESEMRIEMRSRSMETGEFVCNLKSGGSESDGRWTCSVSLPDRENFLAANVDFLSRLRSRLGYFVTMSEEERGYPQPYIDRAIIVSDISKAIRSNAPHSVWYLPADRGGIIHAHQVVVTSILEDLTRNDPRKRSAMAPMSGILNDYLRNLVSLSSETSEYGKYITVYKTEHELNASNMESEILGGRVNIDKSDVKYPRFTWTPDGWDDALALANASSMVTELVPVVLYLRHYVDWGDVLIVEEPEAHLHPSKQIELVRLIAQWVRAGIRVILTTHSEWILEELSTLVGEARRKPGNGLPENHVGLWSFAKGAGENGGGSEIRKVEWDIDEGGFETGTEDVAADQHNRWIDIIDGESR